jgi:hypothetical protein
LILNIWKVLLRKTNRTYKRDFSKREEIIMTQSILSIETARVKGKTQVIFSKKIILKAFVVIMLFLFAFPTINSSLFSTSPFSMPSAKAALYNPTSWDSAISKEDIAYYWAPIWYQNTGGMGIRDFITKFDFDGNWIGADNWDNLMAQVDAPNEDIVILNCSIYYSVVETRTHWFIGYYDFHPQDWDSSEYYDSESHENDLEGALLVISKPISGESSRYGSLELFETEAHGQFYQYSNSISANPNGEDIDGGIVLETYLAADNHARPVLYVQSGGHGVFGSKSDASVNENWSDWTGDAIESKVANWHSDEEFPDGDGVIYYPTGNAEVPHLRQGSSSVREAGYQLLDIGQLWNLRFQPYNNYDSAFANFYTFNGNGEAPDSANLPWGWDDSGDGTTYAGDFFYNPANMIHTHFPDLQGLEMDYTYNPYCIALRFDYFQLDSKPSDDTATNNVFINIWMSDGKGDKRLVLGEKEEIIINNYVLPTGVQYAWVGNDFPLGQNESMTERIPNQLYGIRYPQEQYFEIQVFVKNLLSAPGYSPFPVTSRYQYGSQDKWDGTRDYDWGTAQARISLYGDVIDDDTAMPVFLEGTFRGSQFDKKAVFEIMVTDQSGISEASFEYSVSKELNWISQKASVVRPSPDGQTVTLEFTMDPRTLQRFPGWEISCRFSATDNDLDRPGDSLQAFSEVHSYLVDALMGEKPSGYGHKIAFTTDESQINQDLNNDQDQSDRVIRYYDFDKVEVVNTNQTGENPSMFWDGIAFQSYKPGLIHGLGDLHNNSIFGRYEIVDNYFTIGHSEIEYYSTERNETKYIADGLAPSMYQNRMAFQTKDEKIMYYDFQREVPLVETGVSGRDVSICKDIIAFETTSNGQDLIGYYNISDGQTKLLGGGRNPTVSDGYFTNDTLRLDYYIAFESDQGLSYTILNQTLTFFIFHDNGTNPWATHSGTIWFDQQIDNTTSEIVSYKVGSGRYNYTGFIGQYPSASQEDEYKSSDILIGWEANETMRKAYLNSDSDLKDYVVMFSIPYIPFKSPPSPFDFYATLRDLSSFFLLHRFEIILVVSASVIVVVSLIVWNRYYIRRRRF